ncbi:coproporphyrinogen-III oxidase family protein [Sorangium sp. So ce119]|uniref:coproporphyrinogen-III oxidase family protein n=1 Tax=Sorangium sp. So ce119 TaxID=3133279 RepID=UPI003F635993
MLSQTQPYAERCRLPFILYPPAMWTNREGHDFSDRLALDQTAGDYVVYVSVPFCRVRCKACPYFINTLSPEDPKGEENRYLNALIRDIERWGSYPRWKEGRCRAVYIGGGTGSILTTKNLERLVNAIQKSFPLAEGYGFTLEGNARDFDEPKLDYVASSAINRVSLGVQSFHPEVLKIVGSPHAAEESARVITALHERGLKDVSLDLMYNMPLHTLAEWQSDLERVQDLGVTHFTIYLYRIHEGTAQDLLIKQGKIPPVRDPESPEVIQMRREATRFAERLGYREYMFDHFAKPGFESQYMLWSWREADKDALAIGPGAYSYINGYRVGTDKDVDGYVADVDRGRHRFSTVSVKMDDRGRRERYVIFAFEFFHIDFAHYKQTFGTSFLDDWGDLARKLERKGLVDLLPDRMQLTELGREWRANILLEFVNPAYWNDRAALRERNWSMNTPMVQIVANDRKKWLGEVEAAAG